jgi:membrane protease YdiL (CAAX protease family)
MSARAAWLQVAAVSGVSLALLLVLSPGRPPQRLPWLLQVAAGLVGGSLLSVLVTRRCPLGRPGGRPAPPFLARSAVIGLLAANEELLWRRIVLGELLVRGAVPALAASTLAFALAHRARPGLHLLTGATFGGLYLATGGLAASIAAHAVYNLRAGLPATRRRAPAGCPP